MARRKASDEQVRIGRILDRLEKRYGKSQYVSRFEPMEELVCCILSQHTSDSNSFPAFDRLRAAFPTWEAIVRAGPEGIVPAIKSAGLANQKSKAIVKVLIEIKSRNGGYTIDNLRDMPVAEARKWLESLPSVGPKTASIVLCFSFNMHAIPVDTHVFRVSNRLGLLSPGTNEKKAHDELLSLISPQDAYRFHTSIIVHGRQVCSARSPKCGQCALDDLCSWEGKPH